MYEKIFKEVQNQAYFSSHQKVLIAVSGGVDSMNLLHFLHLYQKKLKIDIAIAHVNHKQRPESEQEEAYLIEWAKSQNIPIYVSHFTGVFSEKAARDFRYDFFKQVMKEYGYTALVTAHHADDQAETILMRIIRGSRLRHLSGISAVQAISEGQLIRPFLTVPKKELADVFHFDDQSNASSDYLRNRIRNHYLPKLEQENPQIKLALQALGDESRLLFQALKDLTAQIELTNCQVFLAQTAAVQEFLLQNYLDSFPELQVSKKQFDQLLGIIRSKANVNYHIKEDYHLLKDYDQFKIEKISPQTDRSPDEKVIECDNIVKYGQYQFEFSQEDKEKVAIPLYNLSPIKLRPRQAGDRINLGNFSKKLRRLFIDDKISSQEREKAIIGEQDGNIIFVLAADKTYLRKASKRDIMRARLYIEKLEKR